MSILHLPPAERKRAMTLALGATVPRAAHYSRSNGPAGVRRRSGKNWKPLAHAELREVALKTLRQAGYSPGSEVWVPLREGMAVIGAVQVEHGRRRVDRHWLILRSSNDGTWGLAGQAGIEVRGVPFIGGDLLPPRRHTSESATADAIASMCTRLEEGWESLLADRARLLGSGAMSSERGESVLLGLAQVRAIPVRRMLRPAREAWLGSKGGTALGLYSILAGLIREWSPAAQREMLCACREHLLRVCGKKAAA